MGLLVNGKWKDEWYASKNGEFVREDAKFRGTINPEDATSGRYHLFVSMACPWAHRTLIFRVLKELTEHIGVTIVGTDMLENGWEFTEESYDNPLGDLKFAHEIYTVNDKNYSGRVTVPILWDTQENTIVSNESADIIRILNTAFNTLTGNTLDFYPEDMRTNINILNDRIYNTVNNGVYRAGFATQQHAYESAYDALFETLDFLDMRLSTQRYLMGDRLTEVDWRLFTTLIRFDAVYFGHFKTNKKRIEDYLHLSHYIRDLYQIEGIAETCNFEHIKRHYYFSHTMINPTQVIPKGPVLDYMRKHNRSHIDQV